MSDINGKEENENAAPEKKAPRKNFALKAAALCVVVLAAGLGILFLQPVKTPMEGPVPELKEGVSQSGVRAIAVSPDGKRLASSYSCGLLRVWDIKTGKQLSVWKTPAVVAALEYGIDGKVMALRLENGEILYYSSADGKQLDEASAALNFSNGKPSFKTKSPEAATPDGRLAFSGKKDGVIIISEKGREIARLFAFGNTVEGGEWLSLSSGGYYAASPRGASLFTVQGRDDTFTLDQFREALHRPDLVARNLGGGAGQKPVAKDGISLATLLEDGDKLPLIEVLGPAKRESSLSVERVQVRVTDRGLGAGRIYIFNGDTCIGLPSLEEVATGKKEYQGKTVYEATLGIEPLKPGRNVISLSVFGGREHGTPESKKAFLEITTSWQPPARAEKRPVLHVLTAAIQKYSGDKLNNLSYTRADAKALREALALQGKTGDLFSGVSAYSLVDGEVSREALVKKFEEISKHVNEEDTFVFFFSGHGDVDAYKDFYFLPASSKDWTSAQEKNILKQDLLGNLFKIKAKNILVMLDTCHAGALEDTSSAVDRAWVELSRKANLAILMAAAGNQYAIESQEDGHGVFTWAVLEALKSRDGETPYVTANKMMEAVRREAPLKAEKIVAKAALAAAAKARGAGDALSLPAGGVAVKGVFDTASLVQEPVAKPSALDFNIFDTKCLPVKQIPITAVSPVQPVETQKSFPGIIARPEPKKPLAGPVRIEPKKPVAEPVRVEPPKPIYDPVRVEPKKPLGDPVRTRPIEPVAAAPENTPKAEPEQPGQEFQQPVTTMRHPRKGTDSLRLRGGASSGGSREDPPVRNDQKSGTNSYRLPVETEPNADIPGFPKIGGSRDNRVDTQRNGTNSYRQPVESKPSITVPDFSRSGGSNNNRGGTDRSGANSYRQPVESKPAPNKPVPAPEPAPAPAVPERVPAPAAPQQAKPVVPEAPSAAPQRGDTDRRQRR